MKARIENQTLIIEIECDPNATTPSASGKTLSIASTRGNLTTDLIIKGKPVIVGLNAYIKR